MVKEFSLEGVPGIDQKDKYNYEMIYAGIFASHTSHRGVTVSKFMHAYSTYYDIIDKENSEKANGKDMHPGG